MSIFQVIAGERIYIAVKDAGTSQSMKMS